MVPLNKPASTVLLGALFLLAAANAAQAAILPTFTLRELIIRADDIVIAEPVDPAVLVGNDVKFVVRKVLRSEHVEAGDAVTVGDMSYYQFGTPFGRARNAANGREEAPRCKQALLFLCEPQPTRKAPRDPSRFNLTASGVRYLTEQGKVLLPAQQINPGPYYFVEQPGADWKALLDRIKLDSESIAAVRRLKEIKDPAERNRAILDWIEKHRREFTGNPFGGKSDPDSGWGSLEYDVFIWILDSCRLEDAMLAIKTWRSIQKRQAFSWPVGNVPTFASEEGRKLLLRIAADRSETIEHRQSALYQLAGSLWPPHSLDKQLGLSWMTPGEHASLIQDVLLLTKDKDDQMRRFAVYVLKNAVNLPAELRPTRQFVAPPGENEVTAAITDVYERHPPGYARSEIAQTLIEMGGADLWQKASGNPGKILVNLQNCNLRWDENGEQLGFSVYQYHNQTINDLFFTARPMLILERLSEEEPPRTVEQKTIEVAGLSSAGAPYRGPQYVRVPSGKLAEGKWRLTLAGKAGERGQYSWRSEPALFVLKRAAKK